MGTLYIGRTRVVPISPRNTDFSRKVISRSTDLEIKDGDLDGITKIGNYAFYKCYFKSIHIQEGVKSIESHSFYEIEFSSHDEKVYLPKSLENIGPYAFGAEYSSFMSIEFPNGCGVKTIGYNAFEHAYNITSFDFSNVKEIGAYAFRDTRLTRVVLPKIQKLGSGSAISGNIFADCEKLISADFSSSTLTTLPYMTFENCIKLTDVYLPYSFKSFGEYVFSFDTAPSNQPFTTIHYPGTVAEMLIILGNSKSTWDKSFGNSSLKFSGKFICSDGNIVRNASNDWVKEE